MSSTIIKFSFLMKNLVGKNDEVNLMVPAIKSHKYSKTNPLEPTTIESHSTTNQGLTHTPTISHKDEKIALVLFLTGCFAIRSHFDEQRTALHKISCNFTHIVYNFTSLSLKLITKKIFKGDETCEPIWFTFR